jgi:hypothetical protein
MIARRRESSGHIHRASQGSTTSIGVREVQILNGHDLACIPDPR